MVLRKGGSRNALNSARGKEKGDNEPSKTRLTVYVLQETSIQGDRKGAVNVWQGHGPEKGSAVEESLPVTEGMGWCRKTVLVPVTTAG